MDRPVVSARCRSLDMLFQCTVRKSDESSLVTITLRQVPNTSIHADLPRCTRLVGAVTLLQKIQS